MIYKEVLDIIEAKRLILDESNGHRSLKKSDLTEDINFVLAKIALLHGEFGEVVSAVDMDDKENLKEGLIDCVARVGAMVLVYSGESFSEYVTCRLMGFVPSTLEVKLKVLVWHRILAMITEALRCGNLKDYRVYLNQLYCDIIQFSNLFMECDELVTTLSDKLDDACGTRKHEAI